MLDENLRRGPWLQEEDMVLTDFVNVLGERRWDYIAKASGLRRSGKSCRLRWKNYLQPNLKHGDISAEEERIIVQLHEQWGNRWSRIAKSLPGRTDNEIKNYWKTYLRKKARIEAQGYISAEKFQPGMDKDGMEDFFISDGHTSAMDGSNSKCMSSSSNIVSSTYSCLNSPYEMRISDWFRELSNDKDELKCRVCSNPSNSCSCYFECDSGYEPSCMWDGSGSIWDWKMS